MIQKSGIFLVALILLVTYPPSLFSLAPEDEYRIVGQLFETYIDGRCDMSYTVENLETGQIEVMTTDQCRRSLPAEAIQPLLVINIQKWPAFSIVEFGMTPDAVQFIDRYQAVIDKYLNERRGTNSAPKMTFTDRIDDDVGTDWIKKFCGDGKNTLVITEDDRYTGESGWLARAWFGYSNYTREIYEADVYFRWNHFDMQAYKGFSDRYMSPELTIVHEFGHLYGYMHTTWDNDIMNDCALNTCAESFENKNSNVWKQWKLRNKITYIEELAAYPKLLPRQYDVVNLTYAISQEKGADKKEIHFNLPVAITTLKGIPGKPLKLHFYIGWLEKSYLFRSKGIVTNSISTETEFKQSRPKALQMSGQPVVSVEGYIIDRDYNGGSYDYVQSRLSIGQRQHWDILIDLLKKDGEEMEIYGQKYKKALKATLVVEGYLDPAVETKTWLMRRVYLVAPWILQGIFD